MLLIRGLHNLRPEHRGAVATIGNFDGVHLGHQDIIGKVRARAEVLGARSTVIIFEPQPKEFFDPDGAPARITRFREKVDALAALAIDQVLVLPFNQQLRALSADQFIRRVLVEGLGVQHLEVGDDFRFGCDRNGDFLRLRAAGSEYGFTVADTHTVIREGSRVSSTRVREALADGAFDQLEQLLGRPFCLCGKVVHGQQLGRTLGLPTANLRLQRLKPPMHGVFAVRARVGQEARWIDGVANLGWRPSVGGVIPLLEVHLLDFCGNLYGQHLQVRFVARIRNEQKFESLDALKGAIEQDVAAGRALLAGRNE